MFFKNSCERVILKVEKEKEKEKEKGRNSNVRDDANRIVHIWEWQVERSFTSKRHSLYIYTFLESLTSITHWSSSLYCSPLLCWIKKKWQGLSAVLTHQPSTQAVELAMLRKLVALNLMSLALLTLNWPFFLSLMFMVNYHSPPRKSYLKLRQGCFFFRFCCCFRVWFPLSWLLWSNPTFMAWSAGYEAPNLRYGWSSFSFLFLMCHDPLVCST